MADQPVIQEIARPDDELGLRDYTGWDTPAQILRSESATSRYHLSIYDLYSEMEDKDGHLFSVLQTRKNGVLSRTRRIQAESDDPRDQAVARFVEERLQAISNFDQVLYNLLDALGKGYAVAEVLWELRDGQVAVSRIKSRHQRRFVFDAQGELRLLNPSKEYAQQIKSSSPASRTPVMTGFASPMSTAGSALWGVPLPPRKFLVLTFNAMNDNPYGKGLCCKAYWYYWFKKNNLKFWVIFNEKFGSPTVIGKYRVGTSEEERKRLFEVIESLQNDTGITIPDNVVIEFLEAKRTGTINSYKDLADWCNDEISKIVLGATLTTSEGRRSGSLALGRVHEAVRNEYIEADAKALMSVMNSQLIPWLVEFNFGPETPCPRFMIDTSADEGLDEEVNIDKQLVGLGVPLPLSYFYEKYKRPVPVDKERVLRYDDNNLYQYHLQFGVLTINEVRRTLGLPPVAWGDRPPAPMKSASAGDSKPQEVSLKQVGSQREDPREEVLREEKPDR